MINVIIYQQLRLEYVAIRINEYYYIIMDINLLDSEKEAISSIEQEFNFKSILTYYKR